MAGAALRLMEADEFLVWCLGKEARYELIEGVPVEMMAGASEVHDRIVVNIISLLNAQLRGSPCRPTTADIALRTRLRSVRRPDVTVTCGPPPRDNVYEAQQPRLVVEVLSPSNVGVAWERKMREFRQREGLDYILLVDAALVAASLYVRSDKGWDAQDFEQLSETIELDRIGCRLAMTEIYDGAGLKEEPAE